MRLLVLSSLFPSPVRPTLGVFVKQRLRCLAEHCQVAVVAPSPWFPFNSWIRRESVTGASPVADIADEMVVSRPRFLSVPRVGKSLDPVSYLTCILPHVAALRREFPFDVIDAEFGYPDGVAAAALGRILGCPVSISFRGDEARTAQLRFHRPQLQWAARSATRVICVSSSLRDLAVELGAAPDRAITVPNGIDTDLFHPLDQRKARRELGLPIDRTILLTVGGLIERKGQHRVLEALPDLIRERPDLLYVAVGDAQRSDPYRSKLEAQVGQLGLQDHVRWVPAQPHHTIPVWMAGSDLYCLATRWEGWCNSLVEALACGLPVVSTRVGGNSEFVREGEDGCLVDYWDRNSFVSCVLRALKHPWDHAAISKRARARSWYQAARDVLVELEAAVQEGATTADSSSSRAGPVNRGS